MDSTPLIAQLKVAETSKGLISQSYSTLLRKYLTKHPLTVKRKWEMDVGPLDEDQWEEALQSVSVCSLNVPERLTQLYTLLRIYYTPHRLHSMGLLSTRTCTRCKRDHGDLLHMLWRCPILHVYWKGVTYTLGAVFRVSIPLDPRHCILNLLDELEWDSHVREALTRALFVACKLIMMHWRSEAPPSFKGWITALGNILKMEKIIYQHRGCSKKIEKLWEPWLGTNGLVPDDLVMDRLLRFNSG